MRLSVFGLGYVGSVTAACLAEAGHQVVGVDVSAEKVAAFAAGRAPVVEPGLEQLIVDGRSSGRLTATTSAVDAIAQSDLALICVGTPTSSIGKPDLAALGRVGREIGIALRGRREPFTIVMRSTVPPGTTEGMFARAVSLGADGDGPEVRYCMNPELTREACAVQDFHHPPFTIIGAEHPAVAADLRALYAGIDAPVIETSVRVAEMVKCVCNAWHALKITFANEVAALCAAREVDATDVMKIFRMDAKLNLGPAYLRPGFAFGGSCLPKDVRGLSYLARASGVSIPVMSAIMGSNLLQTKRGLAAILATGKTRVGLVGLAFKPGTDDVRESPYLTIVEDLQERGCEVLVYDRAIASHALVGANRGYLAERVSDPDALFAPSLATLVAHAEVLVIAHPGADADRAIELARPGTAVIDLEHGVRAQKPVDGRVVARPWRRAAAALLGGMVIALVAGLASSCNPASAHEKQERRVDRRHLQDALDEARPGDTLVLAAGETYEGPFVLPKKNGEGVITIRGAQPVAAPGERVDPTNAAQMPKLVATRAAPVLTAEPGAHGWRLEGLELRPAPGVFLLNLVQLGDNDLADADLPRDVTFEQCYLHGDPSVGGRRGLAMNAAAITVKDSYFTDFKEKGADSQAIASWSGPGPFVLENNALIAAGENVLFGGADPPGPTRVPSNITVRGNYLGKPLAWRGAGWSVKNLFELKDARHVVVEGNFFEHDWEDGQNGFAILFTVRNQDGTAPFSVVEDVKFTGNVVAGAGGGVNLLGRDDSHSMNSLRTSNIVIADNLFYDIDAKRWGGSGALFQLLQGTKGVVIERNTGFQSGNVITADGAPHEQFVFRGNLVAVNEYGIVGSGTAPGSATLDQYFPGAVVEGNVFAGAKPKDYPVGNDFPATLGEVCKLDEAKHVAVKLGKAKGGAEPTLLMAAVKARRD
jgi:GDP-mannose 6-dehydrogenase